MDAGVARLRALRSQPRVAAFARLWVATACAFVAIGAVLPALPRYVKGELGGGDLAVGIVVGCFAVAAVVSRPLGGRLADERSRKLVVVAGLLISALAGVMYLVPLGIAWLIAARLVLGFGDGWVFTAGATWAVDLSPEHRRARAIGIYGLAIWGGMTVGPLCGEALLRLSGYDAVWIFAAVLPLVGAAVARGVPELHAPGPTGGRAARGALVPRGVLAPGLALALTNVGYGALAAFSVLHLEARGIDHGAVVFVTFAASVFLSRVLLGALPDRLGPRRTAIWAAVAEVAGLVLIATATTLPAAVVGAVVMGSGFSLLFPSLAVLAVARVGEDRRGAALGGFTAFFDAGMGIGAPVAGLVAGLAGYPAAFWTAAAAAAGGALVSVRMSGGSPASPRR